MGPGKHGRLAPEPPAGWPALQRAQAVVALLALGLEAFVPGAWLAMLAAVGCLGYSLQTLPQTWTRPGPLSLGWGLVLGRVGVIVVLPLCYQLGGANATLGAVVLIVVMSALGPILVPERAHHLELTRSVGADADAFAVAVLSALLHGSGQVGAWVLFAGALRFLHVLALVSSGTNMSKERGPAAFFQPLTLLMLASGFSSMPLLYVPVCALATVATALVYGRLTLRHAG